MDSEREDAFVRAFVLSNRRNRALFELKSAKKRIDFFQKLCHRSDTVLVGRFMHPIPPSDSAPQRLYALLRANGAPEHCYVMSYDWELDGLELPLVEALESAVGSGMPSILSCIPSKLAYFEAEQEVGAPPRYLLTR